MSGQLDGQRVLVTGASGFIGSHLCRRLCEEGAAVHAVYRSQCPAEPGGLRWWRADLADLNEVKRVADEARPDLIFHLASHVKGAPGIEHVLPTFRSNLESTVNVLTVAAESSCRRVLLAGSLTEPEIEIGERFPSSPYAAAKWASSGYARMFQALYRLPVVIARVFMVYGPGQMDLTKIVPYSTLSLLRQKSPKISSGGRLVDWIYVSDVVSGFLALAQASGVDGATLDLGSGSLVSIRELIEKLALSVGSGVKLEFGALPERPFEPVRLAKAAETLERTGWQPQVSLQEGLERTVDWYRERLQHTPAVFKAIAGS